jgi:drug/metabolite transporter (DMT)-like permease
MLYIITAIFLWSSLGIVIKLSGMSVHLLIFFSCIISATLIGIIVLSKKELRQQLPDSKKSFYLLILAIISLTNTFSYFFAFKNTTIANAVLTHYTAPVIVAFLAPFFLKERLTVKIMLSIAIASVGLWIMLDISPGQFISLMFAGDIETIGIFSGLFSGFAYAVLIIVIRTLAQTFNPFIMTLFQNLIIASILLPFVQIPEDFTSALWAFAVMGVVHSTIAPVLYFRGMKEITANRAAIIGYLEPVCAILLGLIFLSEAVNLSTIIGGAMILYSGYITIRS